MKCDFCGATNPYWSYPVDNFSQIVKNDYKSIEWNSIGGWAACSICHNYIEANMRGDLAWRAVRLTPGLNVQEQSKWYERVRILHDEFFAMRSGSAIPTHQFKD